MIPFRVIRSGVLLAGLLATLGGSLHAEDRFTATLTAEEMASAGLNLLGSGELSTLDHLVARDLAQARQLNLTALPGSLSERHSETERQLAGLDRLSPEQLASLDRLVTNAIARRPEPKERPRLKDADLLSEQGRLRVHGGLSFTYGWAGSGRNFREASAWVSYYDTQTGLGIGFGFSNYSGDYLPYSSYPGYDYGRGYYPVNGTYPGASRFDWNQTSIGVGYSPGFAGEGEGFLGYQSVGRPLRGLYRH